VCNLTQERGYGHEYLLQSAAVNRLPCSRKGSRGRLVAGYSRIKARSRIDITAIALRQIQAQPVDPALVWMLLDA